MDEPEVTRVWELRSNLFEHVLQRLSLNLGVCSCNEATLMGYLCIAGLSAYSTWTLCNSGLRHLSGWQMLIAQDGDNADVLTQNVLDDEGSSDES